MADPLLIPTLKRKRAEISGVIVAYRAKIGRRGTILLIPRCDPLG
jgi:hypothetical protein